MSKRLQDKGRLERKLSINSKTYRIFRMSLERLKNVTVKCRSKSGSQYYIYEGFFLVLLLAICDAYYAFTLIDIGSIVPTMTGISF